jgi:transcriptional regulator with XRE-family HTH domain
VSTSDKLKKLLALHNKKAVARVAGIELGTLLNAISGRRRPHLETLRSIARVIGVDLAWLEDPRAGWPPVRVEKREPAHAA